MRKTRFGSNTVLVLLLVAAFFGVPLTAQQVPPRTFAGKTLEVSDELLDAGMVYHLEPAADTQLAITSKAPLQGLVLTANRGVGFIVAPFDIEENQAPILAGAVRIPTSSLRSGLPQVDSMIGSPQMLNAAEHAEITLGLKNLDSFKVTNFGPAEMGYDVRLTTTLSVLGNSRDIELDGQLTFFPFTNATMARNVGDLVTFRTSLQLKASEIGLKIPPRFAQRFAENLNVEVFFLFNTVSPDRPGNPTDDPGLYAKQLHFTTLLEDLRKVDEAYQYAGQLSREIWDSPQQLSRLANAMSSTSEAAARDLGFARRLTERAIEISSQPDPQILAGMARIQESLGDYTQAVQWHEKAVAAAPEGRQKQGLARRLEALKKKAASRNE